MVDAAGGLLRPEPEGSGKAEQGSYYGKCIDDMSGPAPGPVTEYRVENGTDGKRQSLIIRKKGQR